MAYTSTAFRVHGVAPPETDLAWHLAGEPTRRAFFQEVVAIVLRVKDRSLARGLDRHGLKLKPVTEFTRRHRHSDMGEADPNAPPLTPAYGLSRTRAFLSGRAFKDHAEFFWTNGFGRILNYHRVGARNRWAKSGRLPVRDVIGLSQADETAARQEALAWWAAFKAGGRAVAEAGKMRVVLPPAAKVPVPVPGVAAKSWQKIGRERMAAFRARHGGDLDYEKYTFGVGASRAAAETARARGLASGFGRIQDILPDRPPPRPRPRGPAVLPIAPPPRPAATRVPRIAARTRVNP